jgi:hypothetical protein
MSARVAEYLIWNFKGCNIKDCQDGSTSLAWRRSRRKKFDPVVEYQGDFTTGKLVPV